MMKYMKRKWMLFFALFLLVGAGITQPAKAYYYDDDDYDYSYEQPDTRVAENAYIKEIGNTSATAIELTISCPEADNYTTENSYYYDSYSWKADRIMIYRSNVEDGEYQLIKTDTVSGYTNNGYIVYKDINLSACTMYYYKVQVACVNTKGEVFSTSELSAPAGACTMGKAPKFEKIKATKANTFKATWKKASNMDGLDFYIIAWGDTSLGEFYMNDDKGYVSVGTRSGQLNLDNMKAVKSCGLSTTSCTYKKAQHGWVYYFVLCPYAMVNGQKIQSKSAYVEKKAMDYYFCPNATDPKFFVKRPKTQKKCAKMMKTVKVKTWEYANHQKHKGKKITKTLYIQVNKTLAPTVKQIYKEIYKDPSKPVIYEAGSYRWREGETAWSYHTIGAAIDMNVNENPYYEYNSKGKKKITVGSFYKPKTNPYSIPRNGVVEQIFNKYGFYRLDFDLMHFEAHIEKGRW